MPDLSFIAPTAEIPLVRSNAILRHAKGQPCLVRLPGICRGGTDTTVFAHFRDHHKGMGIKASDYSGSYACFWCHEYIDVGHGTTALLSNELLLECMLAGMQATIGILIRDGIIYVKQDAPKSKPVMKKRAKGKSRPIQNAGFKKRTEKYSRAQGRIVPVNEGE